MVWAYCNSHWTPVWTGLANISFSMAELSCTRLMLGSHVQAPAVSSLVQLKSFFLSRVGYVQLEFDKIAVFNHAWLSHTTLQHVNACLKILDQLKTSLKPGPSILSSTYPLCSLTRSIGTHHCCPSRIGQDICQHTSVQRQIFFWLETKVSRTKKKCIISLRDLVIFQFHFHLIPLLPNFIFLIVLVFQQEILDGGGGGV